MSRKDKAYLNTSLDADITGELQSIHKTCLEPLGITFSAPAVIRHLIKYHQFTTKEQTKRIHDAMMTSNWDERE